MRELTGRVAVVTGAASGIGRGMATAFAGRRMKVVLADVDEAGLASVGEALRAAGAETAEVVTDVRDGRALEALADAAFARFGGAHVLCNNAGVFTVGTQWETSEDDWRWVLEVDLMGVVHGIRAFVPRMLEQGSGHIVNTASMGGLITTPMTGSYGASKHAVVAISKGLRAELRLLDAPIGVTVVCPGEVSTGIVRHLRERAGADVPEPVQHTLDRLQGALDRTGVTPEEAGELVAAGVEADRFWVLPNAESHLELLRAEHEELFTQSMH